MADMKDFSAYVGEFNSALMTEDVGTLESALETTLQRANSVGAGGPMLEDLTKSLNRSMKLLKLHLRNHNLF